MKIKITPTGTGYFLLFLLSLFFVFSIMSQTGLIFIFMGIILGIFVTNIIYGVKCVRSVKINSFNELITKEEAPIETKIQIINKSRRTFNFIKIKCSSGDFLSVNIVEGKSLKHVTPLIRFKVRGVYRLDKMVIETIFPFGLVKTEKRIAEKGVVKVYPKLYHCNPPVASGFDPTLGGHYKGVHSVLFGDDFSGVRPYISGDPVKFIHWKASSKGLGVFTKEFNEEYSGKISFIIQTENKFIGKNDNLLDWAVRAAGSLIFSALDIGHNIEITDLDSRNRLKASPFTNSTEILEFLTQIQGESIGSDINGYYSAVSSLPLKSSLAFIITDYNSKLNELINILENEGRKISVYFPYSEEKNSIELVKKRSCKIFYYNKAEIWEI